MNKAEDFYYLNISGRKIYYSNVTGTNIAVRNIPVNLLPHIKEGKDTREFEKLLKQKADHLNRIKKTEDKLKYLKEKLSEIDNHIKQYDLDPDYFNKLKREREAKQKKDKEDADAYFERMYERYFQSNFFRTNYDVPKRDFNKKDNILEEQKIYSKEDFRRWIVKNHPDKGGSLELCQRVIVAAREKGWVQ
jgi:hypothetical protein